MLSNTQLKVFCQTSPVTHSGMTMNSYLRVLCLFAVFTANNWRVLSAAVPESETFQSHGQTIQANSASLGVSNKTNADYVLGPGDQITLVVTGLEDQFNDKFFRIDDSGEVTLPLVGRVHASGLSSAQLERELQTKLGSILKDPIVVVRISSFGSQPVSVLGAVRNPGIVQLQGRKTLFEVLSLAGGVQTEGGFIVQVSRSLVYGPIPASHVRTDVTSQVSIASIRLKDIINVPNISENIEILPGDTVSVPKSGVVYVVGSVYKPGGYTMTENESLSALQVLSLAQG